MFHRSIEEVGHERRVGRRVRQYWTKSDHKTVLPSRWLRNLSISLRRTRLVVSTIHNHRNILISTLIAHKGTPQRMLGISFLVFNVEYTDIVRTVAKQKRTEKYKVHSNLPLAQMGRVRCRHVHYFHWWKFNGYSFFLKPVEPAPMFQIQAFWVPSSQTFSQNDEGI